MLCSVKAQTNYFSHPFSVSSSQTVLFSRGNLQIQYGVNKLYIGNSQTYCVGANNISVLKTNKGVCDLFLGSVREKQEKSFKTLGDDVGRTLTELEWEYLLYKRVTRSGARYIKAYVGRTFGLFLFPDDFECPSNININVDNINNANPSVIQHFGVEWRALENVGVVFLPAAGYISLSDDPQYTYDGVGCYWIDYRTKLQFTAREIGIYEVEQYLFSYNRAESYLYSYRLVKDCNQATLTSPNSDYRSWRGSTTTAKQPANVGPGRAEGIYSFTDNAGREIRVKLFTDDYRNEYEVSIDGENIYCSGSWSTISYGRDFYVHIHLNTSALAVIGSPRQTKPLANMYFKGNYVYFNSTDAQNEQSPRLALYRVK